jgi:integrase
VIAIKTVIMKVKKELFPKLSKLPSGKYYIFFWYEGYRCRFFNANILGENINPNLLEEPEREQAAILLCSTFVVSLSKGWRPSKRGEHKRVNEYTIGEIAETVLQRKEGLDYSQSYKNDLKRTLRQWNEFLENKKLYKRPLKELDISKLQEFIFSYSSSPQSMGNLKRNISSLLRDEMEAKGVILNYKRIKLPRVTQQLHKPIRDVQGLLKDIEVFNDNLYLCALMTFSLLLRPHREIRCLRVGDFNSDFSLLSLSGARVKSKKNRVLPVPRFVQYELIERFSQLDAEANLFSRGKRLFHNDYFKNRWADYKKQSQLLQPNQTLYSFRHTGAIKVFEKTGSLLKLQQVMGHSDMKVSLTYLRGLEVKQLDVEDLPNL